MKKKTQFPADHLPDGLSQTQYMQFDQEWPDLEKHLGQPRIISHVYYQKVMDWIGAKYQGNPDEFAFLDAGCGHGNDLRAIRRELNYRGRFLGVDLSLVEIIHGLGFYEHQDNDETEAARKLFALGNLRDLRFVKTWYDLRRSFSRPLKLNQGEFDAVYMEDVLQAAGHGSQSYRRKKIAAQQYLDSLFRICRAGGRFFGRVTVFNARFAGETEFNALRRYHNWRFIPGLTEFLRMMKKAGFNNIDTTAHVTDKMAKNPRKRGLVKVSFLAQK